MSIVPIQTNQTISLDLTAIKISTLLDCCEFKLAVLASKLHDNGIPAITKRRLIAERTHIINLTKYLREARDGN